MLEWWTRFLRQRYNAAEEDETYRAGRQQMAIRRRIEILGLKCMLISPKKRQNQNKQKNNNKPRPQQNNKTSDHRFKCNAERIHVATLVFLKTRTLVLVFFLPTGGCSYSYWVKDCVDGPGFPIPWEVHTCKQTHTHAHVCTHTCSRYLCSIVKYIMRY